MNPGLLYGKRVELTARCGSCVSEFSLFPAMTPVVSMATPSWMYRHSERPMYLFSSTRVPSGFHKTPYVADIPPVLPISQTMPTPWYPKCERF